MIRSRLTPGLAALALAACSSPPAAPPAPTGAPTSTAAPLATPAPAPTGAPSAAADAPPESPFHVVAETSSDLSLHVVGRTVYALGLGVVGEVTGEGIRPVGQGRDELPDWGYPAFAGGTPDSTFLIFHTDNGRVGYSILYQRSGEGWREAKTLPYGTLYTALGPWRGGAVLAVTTGTGANLAAQKPVFSVLSGQDGGLPHLPKGEKGCQTGMIPTAMLSFESGDVLAIGPDAHYIAQNTYCYPGDKAMLGRWARGQQEGTILELSSKPSDNTIGDGFGVIAGRAPDDVWMSSGGAFAAPFFAHFDGKAVTPVEGAPGKDPSALAAAADGTLYAVFDGQVHRRSTSGAWELLPLPASHAAQSVAVSGADVWVAASVGARTSPRERLPSALLHLGPAPATVQKVAPPKKEIPLYRRLKPVTPRCKTLFVMLYAFTKVTPADYDFPLTRKALKGKRKLVDGSRFVVTEDGGRRFFGAFVPDMETGRELTALVEKEVSGAKPAFVCADPKVVRELKLDWYTGEIVK